MKKSKLLTLGLLAGAGLLLSINKHRLQILGLKMVLTGIFLKMAVSLKTNGCKMLALGTTLTVLVKCRQAGSKRQYLVFTSR